MAHPVVHFEVLGKDGPALQQFYGEAFGWKIDASNPMQYGIVDTGAEGRGIAGGVAAAQEGSQGWVTFYVEVPDVEAHLQKVEQLGGKRMAGPMDVPGGPTLGIFTDPEGHVVGLVQ